MKTVGQITFSTRPNGLLDSGRRRLTRPTVKRRRSSISVGDAWAGLSEPEKRAAAELIHVAVASWPSPLCEAVLGALERRGEVAV